jgi:hypothetical protein
MNAAKLSLVPFQQASLCLDCDMITAAHTNCFVCGSVALLNLARALNGEEYAKSMPGTLTASGISAPRGFESLGVPGTFSPVPHRFAGERACFPEISHEVNDDVQHTACWYSLRGVANVFHHAMTSAVIGLLVLGSVIQL